MQVSITPSSVNGKVLAPSSKSYTQRAYAAALLRNGKTIIHNAGNSNDETAALKLIEQLGALITKQNDGSIVIESNGKVNPTEGGILTVGESGLAARMFVPIIATAEKKITLTGEGSLLKRPMDFFENTLPQLGTIVKTANGCLPITLSGKFAPKNIAVDGSLSSQFLTGLLFSFCKNNGVAASIHVSNLASKDYVVITLQVIEDFGLAKTVVFPNFEKITVKPVTAPDNILNYTIEGDWSNAAFLLVAGCIAGTVTINGINKNSLQADRRIVDVLKLTKANIVFGDDAITCSNKNILSPFYFDATDCPDLFPPLAALAAYCNGKSKINGIHRLTHKESNRAITLQEEFAKMNIRIDTEGDTMIVYGSEVKGAVVHSRHDHRIAMACAVAALKAKGETIIEDAEAINKSYPGFYDNLKQLKATVSLIN